jgi:predicted dehydrogenase
VEPVRVGLVGAGPWAEMMHAKVLGSGPETRLVGVWARRPEAAAALAGRYGGRGYDDYAAMLADCEAVAFAVPPDVQARMAVEAARAGRALLLDKPIGLTLAEAEELTDAVDAAGVVNVVVLSNRWRPRVREFLKETEGFEALGVCAKQITPAFVAGPYHRSPWRQEHGVLHDVGPHALDLLDAAAGRIESLSAVGDVRGWVALTCRHAGGAISQLALTGEVTEGGYASIELFGRDRALALDFREVRGEDQDAAGWAIMRAEFAAAVRSGTPYPVDVHRALHLQRLIDAALTDLAD